MKRLLILLFSVFGVCWSYSSHACDWDMRHWHGDAPGGWHGQQYYGCPHQGSGPRVAKKFQHLSGAQLFQSKGCTGCHTIGDGPKIGPDLAGLFQRRDETWVRAFIQDPIGKVQTDAKAGKLKEQYGTQMPQLALSPKELDQLLAFLKTATQ